jgi:hypothetical protein
VIALKVFDAKRCEGRRRIEHKFCVKMEKKKKYVRNPQNNNRFVEKKKASRTTWYC